MSSTTSAAPQAGTRRPKARSSLLAHSQPLVWLTGGALAFCTFMIIGLFLLVLCQGLATFWPQEVVEVDLIPRKDGPKRVLGEMVRSERYQPDAQVFQELPRDRRVELHKRVQNNGGVAERWLIRKENFDSDRKIDDQAHRWVDDFLITEMSRPRWALVIERLTSDGRFYGILEGFRIDGQEATNDPDEAWALFAEHHPAVLQGIQKQRKVLSDDLGALDRQVKGASLTAAQAVLDQGGGEAAARSAGEQAAKLAADEAADQYREYHERIGELDRENRRFQLVLSTVHGTRKVLDLADVDRAYPANQLSFWQKLGIYFSRWWEFLGAEPRNRNLEGGIFPALWGTAVMTILMSLAVVPFGVLAALYLREYANSGPIVSLVRIAINNLAGVPSIVFGVFGLGFFCYIVGGQVIDQVFFQAEKATPGMPPTARRPALGVADAGPADSAGGHRGHRGGPGGRAAIDARRLVCLRSEQMANHPADRAAPGHAGHHDRHDPGHGPRGRRSGPADAGRQSRRSPASCRWTASSPSSTPSGASCTWAFTFTIWVSRVRTARRPSRWCSPRRCC